METTGLSLSGIFRKSYVWHDLISLPWSGVQLRKSKPCCRRASVQKWALGL